MSDPRSLPLPLEELPEGLRKFCNPNAPGPARMMAAKGVVPIKGTQLVCVLLQLAADADVSLASTASQSLKGLPEAVIQSAAEDALHPAFLAAMVASFEGHEDVLEGIAANPATDDGTLAELARNGSERISERIAVNQQRLLGAPRIIEALYRNKHTRMSTADRLIELAARNGVELSAAIPAFKAHMEAIQGQLIAEPSDEPLPGDQIFAEALQEDERCSASEDDVVDYDEEDGEETIKDSSKPLMMRIADMTMPEKIRLAIIGDAAARAFLVRDRNRTVAMAAVSSPQMTDVEAAAICRSREVGEDILRFIGNRREWLRNHEVKSGLVFNPKTPVGISLRFVGHMREPELRSLAKSRNVAQPVKSAALQKLEVKRRKG